MADFINNLNVMAEEKINSVKMNSVSIYHNGMVYYHKLFYDNNKKIIRDEIVHHLTPFVMAVWIMDDGWKNHSSIRISSESFSKKENEILQNAIKINFNINCKVVEYQRNNKKYYYLSFNKKNSELLSSLIEKYVIDSMKYKLIFRSPTTKSEAPIVNIEKPKQFFSWREEWKVLKKQYKQRLMI